MDFEKNKIAARKFTDSLNVIVKESTWRKALSYREKLESIPAAPEDWPWMRKLVELIEEYEANYL